jgi:hypothetical protein
LIHSASEAKGDPIVAVWSTGKSTRCIIIGIGICERNRILEDLGIIDRPTGRITHGTRHIRSPATVLISMEDVTGNLARDYLATSILLLQHCRTRRINIVDTARRAITGWTRNAASGSNSIRFVSTKGIDEHGHIVAIDQTYIVKIHAMP